MRFANLFLVQLWRNDKWLFIVALFFVSGQAFFTYKGVETFPFLHWGMYSAPVTLPDTCSVVSFKIDKEPIRISELADGQKMMVEGSFNWYKKLRQQHNFDSTAVVVKSRFYGKITDSNYQKVLAGLTNDSSAIAAYPKWLFQYLADMRLVQDANMEARIVQVRYNQNFQLDTIVSHQAFYYAAQQ